MTIRTLVSRQYFARVKDDCDDLVVPDVLDDSYEAQEILAGAEPEGWILHPDPLCSVVDDDGRRSLQLTRVFARLSSRRLRVSEGITMFAEARQGDDPRSFYERERFGSPDVT